MTRPTAFCLTALEPLDLRPPDHWQPEHHDDDARDESMA